MANTTIQRSREAPQDRLRIRCRRSVSDAAPLPGAGAHPASPVFLTSWELAPVHDLCVHQTFRGHPNRVFPITRFDGPTMDRLLKQMKSLAIGDP